MRYVWTSTFLVLLCACGEDNALLPRERDLWRAFPPGKVTRLSNVVKAPESALVCVIDMYQDRVPSETKEGIDINREIERLQRQSSYEAPPKESDWFLAIATGGKAHLAKYNRASNELLVKYALDHWPGQELNIVLPDGFTPSDCAPMNTAAFYRTGLDNKYLIFGSIRTPVP